MTLPTPNRRPTAVAAALFGLLLAAPAPSFGAVAAAGSSRSPAAVGGRPATPIVLSAAGNPAHWLVFASGPPLSNHSSAAEVQRLHISQAAIARDIESIGGQVVSRYESVANALLVSMPDGAAPLRALPGVRRVVAAPVLQTSLGKSVPFVGATEVTSRLGLDGEGVTVAVVDTGVDAIHAALGGSGLDTDYAANDPAVVEPGTFPTAKVVGGWDFAGTLFDPGCPIGEEAAGICRRQPQPDGDPTDEQGHGTHVASTAAGVGSAPRDQREGGATVSPGVAPGASLVSLKIFGRRGGSDLMLDALEWIIRARTGLPVSGTPASVDVVNLSLGSPYAWGLFEEEGIIRRVVASGTVVVAAAGNDGDRPYVMSSPAAASDALAVAAIYDDGETVPLLAAVWDTPQPGRIETEAVESSFGPTLEEAGVVKGPAVWVGTACSGVPIGPPVRDHIALTNRDGCPPGEKVARLEDMGALAVVVHTDDRPLQVMQSDSEEPIVAVMIGEVAGTALRDRLEAGRPVTVTLDPNHTRALTELAATAWPGTSRGPARPAWAPRQSGPVLKPDLGAPGTTIRAAAAGTGTGGRTASGTSMASPHVAGAAALVIQSDDGLAPGEVAATLTSTKVPTGDVRSGFGVLDAWQAVSARAFVTAPALAGLDFGRVAITGTTSRTLEATLHNGASIERWFRASIGDAGNPHARFALASPARPFRVGPGDSTDLRVDMTIDDAAALGPGPVRGGLDIALGSAAARQDVATQLSLEETDSGGAPVVAAARLGLPVYARLEPTSAARIRDAQGQITAPGSLGSARITLTNESAAPAPVESFLWFGDDGRDTFVSERTDVRQVGARLTRDRQGEPLLEFIATYERPDATPVGLAMGVYLDTDDDGELDWLVVGADAEVIFTGDLSGEWFTVAAPFVDGSAVPDWNLAVSEYYGDVRLDGAYTAVRVRPRTIGLADEPGSDPRPLSFFVAVEDRLWTGESLEVVDVAPGGAGLTAPDHMLRWAPGDRGLSVAPWTTTVAAHGGQTVRVQSERGAQEGLAAPPDGVLVVYPGNDQATSVAETVAIEVPDRLGGLWRAWLPAARR